MSDSIIGKTITAVKIADDKRAMMFIADGEEIIVRADGDCCSSTWIEHVEMPALGLPAKVISVRDLDMPDDYQQGDGDWVKQYGCEIKTDKGDMVIDFRNASNGYYGGDLSWPDDDYFYGGVYGQNVSTEQWVDVESDI